MSKDLQEDQQSHEKRKVQIELEQIETQILLLKAEEVEEKPELLLDDEEHLDEEKEFYEEEEEEEEEVIENKTVVEDDDQNGALIEEDLRIVDQLEPSEINDDEDYENSDPSKVKFSSKDNFISEINGIPSSVYAKLGQNELHSLAIRLQQSDLVALSDSRVTSVSTVVIVKDRFSSGLKVVLVEPKPSPSVAQVLESVRSLASSGGGKFLRETVQQQLQALNDNDRVYCAQLLGIDHYTKLLRIVNHQNKEASDSSNVIGMIGEYDDDAIASALQSLEHDAPWLRVADPQFPTGDIGTQSAFEKATQVLLEQTGLSLLGDQQLICIAVLEASYSDKETRKATRKKLEERESVKISESSEGSSRTTIETLENKGLFFVLLFTGDAETIDQKFKPPFALSFVLERFQPRLVPIEEALEKLLSSRQQVSFSRQHHLVLSKVLQLYGNPSPSSTLSIDRLPVVFLVNTLWPLFEDPFNNQQPAAWFQADSSIPLPSVISTALKLHQETVSTSRKILRQQTDPGEYLLEFVRQLSEQQQRLLRREIRRRKGFEAGHISTSTIRKWIRGNLSMLLEQDPNGDGRKGTGSIFLLINMKSRKEFIGSTRNESMVETVRQLFKAAILPKQTRDDYKGSIGNNEEILRQRQHRVMLESNRELLLAIRISKLDDWRFVVLEVKVALNDLKELERRYIMECNTLWPNGYNV